MLGNDTDIDGDALTSILVSSPGNGSLTLNEDGSFDYTPNENFHGEDSFTYQANDGEFNSNTATVNITVNPVNDDPVAVDDQYSFDEDDTLTIAADGVLGNDTDIDGDALSSILVSSPGNGSLTLNEDGSFSYTADANFNGVDSFTYQANDGQSNSNPATVTINVIPVNDDPVAEDDQYSVDEDETLTIEADGVLGNDTDIDEDTLTSILVSEPTNGNLNLNEDGSFSYTPDSNFNGVDSFTYQANDGTDNSQTATVTIEVTEAPVTEQIVSFGTTGDDIFDAAITQDFNGIDDIVFAGSGDDTVDVTFAPGGNRIDLGSGADWLFGGTDNRILAGSGDDTLFVGSAGGNNVITGGAGMDQFWIVTDEVDLPTQANTITDFTTGEDLIGFGATDLSFEDLDLIQDGSSTVVHGLNQDLAILLHTQASALSESDFVFA